MSIRAIYNLVKKFQVKESIFDLPRQKRAHILMDDKLTSTAIKALLLRKWSEVQTLHAISKRGPRKHVTGMQCSILVLTCMITRVKMKL